MLVSLSASASTFYLDGGESGTISGLPSLFDPSNAPGDIVNNITIFDSAGEGVGVTGPASLTYTYIGKEAGSTNAFITAGSGPDMFLTADFLGFSGTVSGSTFETTQSSAGLLDFSFLGLGTCCVNPGMITNGVGNLFPGGVLSFAVSVLDESSLYLMFGDGAGDKDFDDMLVRVDVSAVPVPAAFWLFGTALIGFIGISRRTQV
jgi:hypothetical protein